MDQRQGRVNCIDHPYFNISYSFFATISSADRAGVNDEMNIKTYRGAYIMDKYFSPRSQKSVRTVLISGCFFCISLAA